MKAIIEFRCSLTCLIVSLTLASLAFAQNTREYIRANGKVIAIEAPSILFSVAPDPVSAVLGPNSTLSFSANKSATWVVSPVQAGNMSFASTGAGQATVFTVASVLSAGVTQATIVATALDGSGVKNIPVQLMTPIVISGGVTSLAPGGSAQYSANIPVTWEVSPANAATVSPVSTSTNGVTTLSIVASPPGNPTTVTLTARDARAQSNSLFLFNTAATTVTIQYPAGGPPVPLLGYSSIINNGTIAGLYKFSFTDPQAQQNIQWMAVHFSGISAQSVPYSCVLYVFPAYGGYSYLFNDDGIGAVGGYIGQDQPLRNSLCLIEMKGLRYFDTTFRRVLEVPVYLTPTPFLGSRDIYISAGNSQGNSPWVKVGSVNTYYVQPAASLMSHPGAPANVNQDFRTSAMSTIAGSDIAIMGLSANESYPSHNNCQLWVYRDSNFAYIYNNTGTIDSSPLTSTSYTMSIPQCNVPVASIKIDSYLQASPPAPFFFLSAQIQANQPMLGLQQTLVAQMYYSLAGSYYYTSAQPVGYWNIP